MTFSKTCIGFVICRVCGKTFPADAARRYTVKERDGLGALFGGNTFFDAFDCPECGCQNVVGPRYLQIGAVDKEPTKEEIEAFEEQTEEPEDVIVVTTETTVELEEGPEEPEEGPEEPEDFTNE